MKSTLQTLLLTTILFTTTQLLHAADYYVLCEGNFGQANSSLWSFDESFSDVDGPLVWDTGSNPLGDVGQSLTLYNHKLYIIMNNSHEIHILDLESGTAHESDIELPGASPRFMAIQRSQERGFVSSWNLGGLLIIDLNTNAVVDTFLLGGLPEELLIDGDRLFVSMTMNADWSAGNQVHQLDISTAALEITQTYEVINGPGSMTLFNNQLYVTSIYYNDIWESFSGTSCINLQDGTVLAVDHGAYSNYSADIDIIGGIPYRTYGDYIVPLNEDLSFNTAGSIGNTAGIYSFSVQNDKIVIGTSDFVAPDEVLVYSLSGLSLGSFNVGALPGDVLYYNQNLVALDDTPELPTTLSLGNNYPNPFNPLTSIPFQLNQSGSTKLQIFDARGCLVNTLVNEDLNKGVHQVSWNGENNSGTAVSSGIYFALLSSNSEQSIIKMNLIK